MLFLGVQTLKAQEAPCVIDTFIDEILKENKAKEFSSCVDKNGQENVFDAWSVLYKGDFKTKEEINKATRLDTDNLELLIAYRKKTNRTVDDLAHEILGQQGFKPWLKKVYYPWTRKVEHPWIDKLDNEILKKRLLTGVTKDGIYKLFTTAKPGKRAQLIKIYKMLLEFYDKSPEVFVADRLETLQKVMSRFEYKREPGAKGLAGLFKEKSDDLGNIILRIKSLDEIFDSKIPITIKVIQRKNSSIGRYYDVVVVDKNKTEIFGFKENTSQRIKFLDNVDDTYQAIGTYKRHTIFQKGDEIGFKKKVSEKTPDDTMPLRIEGIISKIKKTVKDKCN